jgi:2-methylcitrate dehydratase PrpD
MPSTEPPALVRLARRSCAARQDPVAQTRAAWHVLDWLGCAAHGASSATGQVMARWLDLQSSGPVPTLAGRDVDAAAAAAYHGALGSTLEMDDVHRSAILHPGPVVVPAAWAAAHAHSSGAAFLGAVVAGYEAMIVLGRTLGPTHYKLWHSTATAGAFGAAAAAAAMMGLDEPHTSQALALAGTRCGGLWQVRHETQMGKTWHMAGAAREGVTAAQLAQVGMTGPLGVLDGPSGWFAATAADADVRLIDTPRATPWIDDVSFKPWPACRHAHPAMDALRQALPGRALNVNVNVNAKPHADAIQHIHVRTYADALLFCDRPHPVNSAQARFSIQHALAACLLWGEPQLAHYEAPCLQDSAVRALREQVHLQVDDAMQARYPQHYGADVRITWRDGSQAHAVLQDTYGDPARPMAPAALQAKAHMLMHAAGWGHARIQRAFDVCAELPQAPNLLALHALLRA